MRTFTKENVQAVYDEVDRRIGLDVKNGYVPAEDGYILAETIEEYRKTVLQGVYSVLMTLSADWPTVRQMCDEEEERRGWKA